MPVYPPTVTNVMLSTLCKQERQDFYRDRTTDSPACLELFRRAFAQDQEAWEKIIDGFKPQLTRWVKSWFQLFTLVEPDDLVQDAFLSFYRYAPQKPQLLNTSSLGPVIKYLYLCTKSAALQLKRKHEGLTAFVDLEEHAEISDPGDLIEQTMVRTVLQPFVERWVGTPEEQIIFSLYFEYNYKPQEIFAAHHQVFQNYNEVAKILQRLIRRMRKDEIEVHQALYSSGAARQKSENSAFVPFSLSNGNGQNVTNVKDANVDTPCPYDDILLLDYLMGRAEPALVHAIERSPTCMQAANTLQQTLGPLMKRFHRRQCPEPLMLLEYQERLLTGVEQLMIQRHVEQCPLCQQELQLSVAMDNAARPFAEIVTPLTAVRRMVEALLQSPLTLAQPVRGDWLHYRTPELLVMVSVRRSSGKARTWNLRAQLRNDAGELITAQIEEAIVQRLGATPDEARVARVAPEESSLVFKELTAGDYALRVFTAETEIRIHKITIGDE